MKEEDGYYPLLDIYTYPALVHLKDFLGGIHHCVTVVGKQIFDSNFPFAFTLTQDDMGYSSLTIMKQKGWMVNNEYWNTLYFSRKIIIKISSEVNINNMCLMI